MHTKRHSLILKAVSSFCLVMLTLLLTFSFAQAYLINSITHEFRASPPGFEFENAIYTRRCITANYHWLASERLLPTYQKFGPWKYGSINGCQGNYPIVELTTETVKVCVGASDSDPGTGNILYSHDNNRCSICTRSNGGTGNSVNCTEVYNIAGRVLDNQNNPLAGVVISTNNGKTATTDTNGAYSFKDIADGTYVLTPTKSGYAFSPSSLTVSRSSYNMRNQNFTAGPVYYSISGYVTDSTAAPAIGVTMTLQTGIQAVTDGMGYYEFGGLNAGVYTVTLASPTAVTIPISRAVTSPPSATNQNFALADLHRVYGYIFDDNQQPLAGVTVRCRTVTNDEITATTDNTGLYSCGYLPPDDYLVEPAGAPVMRNSLQSTTPRWYPISSGWFFLNSSRRQDFATAASFFQKPATVKVIDATTKMPISGAVVNFGGENLITNANGEITKSLFVGEYMVTAYRAGTYKSASIYMNVTWLPEANKATIELRAWPNDAFRLPYPRWLGKILVTQGNFRGAHTGYQSYAIDFGLWTPNVPPSRRKGLEVAAARQGMVKIAETGKGTRWSMGKYIVLEHKIRVNGKFRITYTWYLHLSKINVSPGDFVQSGDVIGIAGNTGNVQGNPGIHLHFMQNASAANYRHWERIKTTFADIAIISNQRCYNNGRVPVVNCSYQSSNPPSLTYLESPLENTQPVSNSLLTEDDFFGEVFLTATGTPTNHLELFAGSAFGDVTQIRLAASEASLDIASWQPYTETLTWSYPVVYVQFQDALNNLSPVYRSAFDSVVSEPLQAGFTLTSPICVNADLPLVNQTTPLCEQCSWAWDFGNGNQSEEMLPEFDFYGVDGFSGYTEPGVYTITLTAKNQNQISVYFQSIQALPAPSSEFTIARSGATVILTANDLNATEWLWDFGDGNTGSGRNVTYTYPDASWLNDPFAYPPQITLTVTGANGCASSEVQEIYNEFIFLPLLGR